MNSSADMKPDLSVSKRSKSAFTVLKSTPPMPRSPERAACRPNRCTRTQRHEWRRTHKLRGVPANVRCPLLFQCQLTSSACWNSCTLANTCDSSYTTSTSLWQ